MFKLSTGPAVGRSSMDCWPSTSWLEVANAALGMAHQNLPGFTALMERNVRVMRPGVRLEKTLQAVLAGPAKPKFRRADPQPTTVRSASSGWTS